MSTYYVDSADGDDTTPPSASWWNGNQTTYKTVTKALSLATGSGDIIRVSHTNAYSSAAAISWDVATAGQWVLILSTNRSTGAYASGAKVTVGTNSAALTLGATRGGVMKIRGMYLEGNNGSSSNNTVAFISPSSGGTVFDLEDCTISTPGTGGLAEIQMGTNSAARQLTKVTMKNCTVILHANTSSSGGGFNLLCCDLSIQGLTVQYAGAKPPTLFRPTQNGANVRVTDSDLSGFDSGQLVLVTNFMGGKIEFERCKLHATPSRVSGTWPANNQARVRMIDCDSGDTLTQFSDDSRLGTTLSTTSVYWDGTTEFGKVGSGLLTCLQIQTTSDCSEAEPYRVPILMGGWVPNIGSTTATVRFAAPNGDANMNDRNLDFELSYISDASYPRGSVVSTRNANPFTGTAADYPSSSATITGLTSPVKQKADIAFSPAEGSVVEIQPNIRAASKTIYLKPEVEFT